MEVRPSVFISLAGSERSFYPVRCFIPREVLWSPMFTGNEYFSFLRIPSYRRHVRNSCRNLQLALVVPFVSITNERSSRREFIGCSKCSKGLVRRCGASIAIVRSRKKDFRVIKLDW